MLLTWCSRCRTYVEDKELVSAVIACRPVLNGPRSGGQTNTNSHRQSQVYKHELCHHHIYESTTDATAEKGWMEIGGGGGEVGSAEGAVSRDTEDRRGWI